eukprot:1717980-Pleurochrysis_carterae.AAC.2
MGNRARRLAALLSLAGAAGQARMSESHRSAAESCWRAEPLVELCVTMRRMYRERVCLLAVVPACPFRACTKGGGRMSAPLRRMRACERCSVGERRRLDPE